MVVGGSGWQLLVVVSSGWLAVGGSGWQLLVVVSSGW